MPTLSREFMLKVRPEVPLTLKVDEAQDRQNEDSGSQLWP